MVDYIDIFTYLKDKRTEEPKKLFNVHEIMEALGVDKEDILYVKNALEGGIDRGDYERKISKGKAWYRFKEVEDDTVEEA